MGSSGNGYTVVFEETMEKYGDMIYRICLTITGNPEDAGDSFQETFLRLVKNRNKIKDEEHLKAWLIHVATNCSRSIASSPWNRRTQGIREEDLGGGQQPREDGLLVELQKLPSQYAVVLYLFYYEEYSIREIGQLLGKKENTVKTHLDRGRKLLKKKLEEGGGRP